MFIQVNHAQSSKALSYGWTDLSAKGGLRKGSDLLKELGYDVKKGWKHINRCSRKTIRKAVLR